MASAANDRDLETVIRNVQNMVYDSKAQQIIQKEKYSIHNVTWEDCARNKGSVWGPCISDMTLQVNDSRMPVIRKNNFTDLTWDVLLEKIPIVVGNEKLASSDKDEKSMQSENASSKNVDSTKLETVSLKEYLKNFDKYMSRNQRAPNNNNNNNNNNSNNNNNNNDGIFGGLFGQSSDNNSSKINLLRKDESKDSHCIVSTQACFLPIAQGTETLFNVALFNYQSRKEDPAVLAIVATSKGTSAQIIEGSEQKLLFNNNGMKADFLGQRLKDNRIERGVTDLKAAMTTEEKQDNCIVIIQVPLKQKPQRRGNYQSFSMNDDMIMNECAWEFDAAPAMAMSMNNSSHISHVSKRRSKSKECNVESAIVKVAPKTHPMCKCGKELEKLQLQFCYDNFNKSEADMVRISCDICGVDVGGKTDIVWHCKQEKNAWQHKDGYDLCQKCAKKQLEFDELNGMKKIERDERYPIRVTLQYYKSTDNGVITSEIMKGIATQLQESQKHSDFVGSLVTEQSNRPTEWVKRFLPFIVDRRNNNDNNNNNGNNGNNGNNNSSNNNRKKNNERGYDLIRDVLGGLQMGDYYKAFVHNEINDSRLMLLEDNDLDKLFDKLGPQIVFRHWLRSYKNTNKMNDKNNDNNVENNDDAVFNVD